MSQTVVRTTSVHFDYSGATVLEDVSLDVERGELLFLIGPNGAGKTTLLKLVGGLLEPRRGRVTVFDESPFGRDRRQLARRLSYLPQSYRIAFPFTAMEIVLMGRYAHQRRRFGLESQTDVDAARAAMDACAVSEFESRPFDQLSGGEKRRVLLAQALCQRAELLLLDEPTSALDPAHAISVFTALRRAVDDGKTAIVVSHDLNLAARFGDRVALLRGGSLVAVGTSLDVLSSAETGQAFGVELTIGTHSEGTPFVVPR